VAGRYNFPRGNFHDLKLMPLYDGSHSLIRSNLMLIARGERAKVIAIGKLTALQHDVLNAQRISADLPRLLDPEILFLGRHLFSSRHADGYSIEDMVEQIASALSAQAEVVPTRKMSALCNPRPRDDGYGNRVNDAAVLELSARKPKAELFSTIPRGDWVKPRQCS
jgi:hypothetical protein